MSPTKKVKVKREKLKKKEKKTIILDNNEENTHWIEKTREK